MVKSSNVKKIFAAVALVIALAFAAFMPTTTAAFAAGESVISGGDGTYEVPVSLDMKMGADNFTNPVTVEKQDGRYYLTFGYSSSIGYIELALGDKRVGSTTEQKDGWTYRTYTISEQNLKSTLSFSAYINAMSRETTFNATVDLDNASKISDAIRDLGERPAEFVPVITTGAAKEYSLKVGTVFPIPAATATMGENECAVAVTAVYNGAEVAITDGKLALENAGEYTLVYRATSPEYKTSLGNDAFSEYVVTIRSVTGENEIAKFGETNGNIPENAGIIAGRIGEDSAVYEKAAAAMKKIADEFEVYSVEIIGENGDAVTPAGTIELLLRADDYFDRTKAEVYYMDADGNIYKLTSRGYGRFVIAETDKTGTFIVCVPGVAFRMPMWGYALIAAGCVVVVASVATVIIVAVKRNKKAKQGEK